MRHLAATLGLLLVTITPCLAQSDPPATPIAPSAAARVRARTSYTAFLRTEPQRAFGTDRAVIAAGTDVEVFGVVADEGTALGGYWYQVRAFPAGAEPLDGWMHSTIVYLAPEQLAQLTASAPPAAEATTGPAVGTNTPPEVTLVPSSTPTPDVTIAVPLALRVCYDVHANDTCDVDEGIAGVLVYAADAATGQILFAGSTDATGLARFTWQAPVDAADVHLLVTVPYFQEVRDVSASYPQLAPVLVTALAPIPAWLP